VYLLRFRGKGFLTRTAPLIKQRAQFTVNELGSLFVESRIKKRFRRRRRRKCWRGSPSWTQRRLLRGSFDARYRECWRSRRQAPYPPPGGGGREYSRPNIDQRRRGFACCHALPRAARSWM